MRSSRVVRASGCQCQSPNSPGFVPSILRHSGIRGVADEAALKNVHKKKKSKSFHFLINAPYELRTVWSGLKKRASDIKSMYSYYSIVFKQYALLPTAENFFVGVQWIATKSWRNARCCFKFLFFIKDVQNGYAETINSCSGRPEEFCSAQVGTPHLIYLEKFNFWKFSQVTEQMNRIEFSFFTLNGLSHETGSGHA